MPEEHPFEQFMRSYQNMVFSTAVRLLASEAEAQDVSQEVFLKAYERFAELSASPTAGGWLKTVTTNLCLNHLSRYRGRWRFFSEMFHGAEGEEEEDFTKMIPALESVEREVEAADERRALESALARLPANQRVPLVLFHFEGKSYEEVSQLTKASLAKVKTDIFRGREALRKRLSAVMAGEDGWPAAPDGEKRAVRAPGGRAGEGAAGLNLHKLNQVMI